MKDIKWRITLLLLPVLNTIADGDTVEIIYSSTQLPSSVLLRGSPYGSQADITISGSNVGRSDIFIQNLEPTVTVADGSQLPDTAIQIFPLSNGGSGPDNTTNHVEIEDGAHIRGVRFEAANDADLSVKTGDNVSLNFIQYGSATQNSGSTMDLQFGENNTFIGKGADIVSGGIHIDEINLNGSTFYGPGPQYHVTTGPDYNPSTQYLDDITMEGG